MIKFSCITKLYDARISLNYMEAGELRNLLAEQEAMIPGERDPNSELVGQLLNDEKVMTELFDFQIWAGLTNSAKLTFLENNDVECSMHLFEADVCKFGRIYPELFRDETFLLKISQARQLHTFNLKRSVGTTNGFIGFTGTWS